MTKAEAQTLREAMNAQPYFHPGHVLEALDMLGHAMEALGKEWRENHAEHCVNNTPGPCPKGAECYWPKPALLREWES